MNFEIFFFFVEMTKIMNFFSHIVQFSIFSNLNFGLKRGSTRMPVKYAFSFGFQWNLAHNTYKILMKAKIQEMLFGIKLRGGGCFRGLNAISLMNIPKVSSLGTELVSFTKKNLTRWNRFHSPETHLHDYIFKNVLETGFAIFQFSSLLTNP